MIILRNSDKVKVEGMSASLVTMEIEVSSESPDVAVGMLYAGLDNVVNTMIKMHEPQCDCVAIKVAKNIKYHLQQIEDENKTIIGETNANAHKNH